MSPQNEAKAILKLCKEDPKAALEIVESQLNTLYARAQILLSLAGIVVTVTGFSGRLIAGSSPLAQYLLRRPPGIFGQRCLDLLQCDAHTLGHWLFRGAPIVAIEADSPPTRSKDEPIESVAVFYVSGSHCIVFRLH